MPEEEVKAIVVAEVTVGTKWPMLKRMWCNIVNHPETSAMGIASFAGGVATIIHDRTKLYDTATVGAVLGGLALLMSRDPVPKSLK